MGKHFGSEATREIYLETPLADFFFCKVRVIHLDDYLRRMKTVGYKLVGVEQTAHSRLLTTYEFAPFTLLLLGSVTRYSSVSLFYKPSFL